MSNGFAIALLIPHYNQRSGLATSLRSVTFAGSLIIVIVDDGSDLSEIPDDSWISSLALSFPVKIINLPVNAGITHALNEGLAFILNHTNSQYIARLDCGDYNLPQRLNDQYNFMNTHPEVALCGTWCDLVSEKNILLYSIRTPVSYASIKRIMLSDNCFVHPSVMFRTEAVRNFGFYPDQYPAAEDFAYFSIFAANAITANIPKVLVVKIRSYSSISYKHRRTQLASRLKIILKNFKFHPRSFWGIFKTIMFLILPVTWTERLKEKIFA